MPTGHRPAPPPGSARVAISGTVNGHKWANVFYLNLSGTTVTLDDLANLAGVIVTQWTTHVGAHIGDNVTMTQVDVRYIPTSGEELRYIQSASVTGSRSGTPLESVAACFVVKFVILDYYRGGHPRWYIPGVIETDVSNGSDLDPSIVGTLVTEIDAMRTALNAYTHGGITTCEMGTVRFSAGNAWLTTPRFVQFQSTAAGKNFKLGSQRRRILA